VLVAQPAPAPSRDSSFARLFAALVANVERVIQGKRDQVHLAFLGDVQDRLDQRAFHHLNLAMDRRSRARSEIWWVVPDVKERQRARQNTKRRQQACQNGQRT